MSKLYSRRTILQIAAGVSASLIASKSFANSLVFHGRPPKVNDIGTPGTAGFGVGIVPSPITGFTALSGTSNKLSDNYGNYQYADGSIMCWVPAFYYRYGHADNPTFGDYGVNSVDVLPESAFADVAAANAAGYALHRAFIDGGAQKRGFMVDKYFCSKNALGAGYVASSIKNGLPISTHADHNPIADLTACADNAYYYAVDAAHARDGVNGAVNASSIFFCQSGSIFAALALLSLAHAQAATATTYCAWYDATGVANFPKGCNNNALADVDDTSVKWESDGYSNCGKTGSAGYGGGAGNLFAKSTHNGQNCGEADVNGLMWQLSLGVTSAITVANIEGLSRANPCVVAWTGHGLATGAVIQIGPTDIAQAEWTALTGKLYAITVIDPDHFSLDGVDTSGFAEEYNPDDPGQIRAGTFYAAKESTAMKDFTSGTATDTDHWGTTGTTAMMDEITIPWVTAYPDNGYAQRYGNGANQVLSGDVSGPGWLLTGLGIPQSGGASASGTTLFGQDYFYQYLQNQLFLRSGGSWSSYRDAGPWAAGWLGNRASSTSYVGFRLACYPV